MNNELLPTQIENYIFTVRGMQVMLDRDLAEMYQVETKRLNEQVKRNIERFPEDFMFQLTEEEWNNLKSQNAISSLRSHFATLESKQGKHRKYLPFVFTEQGVAGLSGILKSEVAVKIHVSIMRAFVAMRKMVLDNQLVFQRLDKIERKQLETDHNFEKIFNALERQDTIPSQGVFFDGQVFDAYELASKIIRSAKENIVLIDNYIDETTFTHLSKKKKGVNALILTKNISKQLQLDLKKANEQYGNFAIKTFTQSHDRFLIIDEKEVYHIGASLKDLGKKWFAFSKMDKSSVENIVNSIEK
ncbi:MAG: ORF6N domain-containing protein [Bergeyella sp.]